MKEYPYWWDTVPGARNPEPAVLPTRADVAIVGAGYTGLAAARQAARAGASVVVLERERVGWGASSRNGGQVLTGFKVDQMTIVHELEKALAAKPSTLALLTLMLAAYALLEVVEGVGLWLLKRWGEYFAVIATSVFLPLEIHDLAKGITMTRLVTFSINVAAVIYLLISKRLFGLRGGRKAYDEERRGEQLLEVERAATT